jgi:hypothetical protein
MAPAISSYHSKNKSISGQNHFRQMTAAAQASLLLVSWGSGRVLEHATENNEN